MLSAATMLRTETPSSHHAELDRYAVPELVDALVEDQARAINAVRAASAQIAQAIDAAVPRVARGGRLLYVGAGTSGRLGVLDSVELYPTFSWPKDRALALLAGGRHAGFEAVEGAEDDQQQGAADLRALAVGPLDVVMLISASGNTLYVVGALQAARAAGALTIAIVNNPGGPLAAQADATVMLDTGSELISGSTRLTAGTAQKIVLNTLSSAIMVRLHKVHGNLMVDLAPTNAKLRRRAVSLTVQVTGTDEITARRALQACGYRVKVAIVMLMKKVDAAEAVARLDRVEGNVRAALQ